MFYYISDKHNDSHKIQFNYLTQLEQSKLGSPYLVSNVNLPDGKCVLCAMSELQKEVARLYDERLIQKVIIKNYENQTKNKISPPCGDGVNVEFGINGNIKEVWYCNEDLTIVRDLSGRGINFRCAKCNNISTIFGLCTYPICCNEKMIHMFLDKKQQDTTNDCGDCVHCKIRGLNEQITNLQKEANRQLEIRRGLEKQIKDRPLFVYINIPKIQQEQKEWELKNFGKSEWFIGMTGITEEVGELAHALLKRHQNIRTNEPHVDNAKDALGDIFVYMMSLCNVEEWDLATIISDTWNKVVKKRDWKADSVKGEKSDGMGIPSYPEGIGSFEVPKTDDKSLKDCKTRSVEFNFIDRVQAEDRVKRVEVPISKWRYQCRICLAAIYFNEIPETLPTCCGIVMLLSSV